MAATVFSANAGWAAEPGPVAVHYWPAWRGPLGNRVAPHADPPLVWSPAENVRWKVDRPGESTVTPIVWGDNGRPASACKAAGCQCNAARHE